MVGMIVIAARFLFTAEDDWIQDDRGVWIKHGNPKDTPDYVKVQQDLIAKAQKLFSENKNKDLSAGPCLGKIAEDWVVDTAHNPRQKIDDELANQCPDYVDGKVSHFIELSPDGDILRIQ